MPMVHIVCGATGAGKTTIARELATEHNGLRFSIDEWMSTLFAADAPAPLTFEWAIERVGRCEAMIWRTCLAALAAGRDVVLDLGFDTRAQRDRFRTLTEDAGYTVAVHHVMAGRKERLARVRLRNEDRSEILAFKVTDGMFDFMEDRFEPPSPEEGAMERKNI